MWQPEPTAMLYDSMTTMTHYEDPVVQSYQSQPADFKYNNNSYSRAPTQKSNSTNAVALTTRGSLRRERLPPKARFGYGRLEMDLTEDIDEDTLSSRNSGHEGHDGHNGHNGHSGYSNGYGNGYGNGGGMSSGHSNGSSHSVGHGNSNGHSNGMGDVSVSRNGNYNGSILKNGNGNGNGHGQTYSNPTSPGYEHNGHDPHSLAQRPIGHERPETSRPPTRESYSRPLKQRQDVSIMRDRDGFLDFFSSDVFNVVLHNPTTSHRFLRFCQSRSCGENIEFLEKVDAYNRLLDEVSKVLGEINSTYTSTDASRQINISYGLSKQISSDIKTAARTTLPYLEGIFVDAQDQIEKLVASDIYPRFVKHQVTTSATLALADQKQRYQGLGDCFCLTDPAIADNPITYASDGFVDVTGYSRKEIIPRNCRFLQGASTDRSAVKRLRVSIDDAEETVELLLNYRKNGDPFWNLLYVAPLYDEHGEIKFYIGGQINCSTTISSCSDVLKILSLNDDEAEPATGRPYLNGRPPSVRPASVKRSSSFFKSWKKASPSKTAAVPVLETAGMENTLLDKLGKMNFQTQVEAFYTAYSKYLVLRYSPTVQTFSIQHYSPGVVDMLCLNTPNGGIAPIFNKEIFKVLQDHSLSPSSNIFRALKSTVKDNIRMGKPVSVELGLLTATEMKRGFNGRMQEKRVEERYISHWTPLKEQESKVGWVVLTIAPK